ncbi:MAG: Crp/Fnr family transcriptional regulator [Sphingomonadaceae bacterium]
MLALERYARFSSEDREAVEGLLRSPLTRLRAGETVIHEGTSSPVIRVLSSGWAYRYKDLPDGRRQIVGFLLPGDLFNLHIRLREVDHTIAALTPISFHTIPLAQFAALMERRANLSQAALCNELVTSAIQREWLVSLGQRSAFERLGHLFMELFTRLKLIGMTSGNSCGFPLTQNDLADATGVTPVHLNRVMQDMRREKLVELRCKRLQILDEDRLRNLAMFDAAYLQVRHESIEYQ